MNFNVVSINISSRKGIQKTPVDSVECIENHGIEGDAHAGTWHRQISFLAVEAINRMKTAAANSLEIHYGDFGENIVTSGMDWTSAKPGGKIVIGSVEMEVTQIGKECHSRCAIYDAVGDCIMPKQGIFARVLKGGKINVGDSGYYSI